LSPASRRGAGTYVEGELGAFYLMSMLADIPAHGLPGARIAKVRFQDTALGYKLDDLTIYGVSPTGDSLLEIQSKRDITFLPGDKLYRDIAAQIAKSRRTDVPRIGTLSGLRPSGPTAGYPVPIRMCCVGPRRLKLRRVLHATERQGSRQ